MITEYILVFAFVFAVSFIFIEKWNGRKKSKSLCPPSLSSIPLLGSLLFLRKFEDIAQFFMEKSFQLGPIFTFRVGNKLVLTLNNGEVIEEALVRNSSAFSSRPRIFMQRIANPDNKGLIFMDTTPEWKRIHKSSLSIMKEFGFGDKGIMEGRILREVEAMTDYIRQKRGNSFYPKELYLHMSSNIIMNILFASRSNYDLGIPELAIEIDRLGHLLDMVLDVAPFLKYIPPYKGKMAETLNCFHTIHRLLEIEMDRCKEKGEKCFVSEYILKEGPNYDRDQLYFLLRDLTAAGADTTANTLLWSLVVLANHPEIQKKLQHEIDAVIPRDRSPTLNDRFKMPFVEATVLELYRWRTLIPLSVPRLTSRDTMLRNYFIPAGTFVLPNLHAAHSDPNVWGDPEVFRPERFLDKENNVVGKDRVIPFSLGRRSCFGEILARAEVFLILTGLIQQFTVLPPEGHQKVCEEPLLPIGSVSSPTAFTIRVVERERESDIGCRMKIN